MNEICATQVKLVRNPRYKERFSKAGREAVKFARGFAKGVWLGLKDMVKDSWEMIKNPGKIVKGTIDMLRKPIKTFKAMLNFGKELAREFIGDDSEKKGEMIGKVSAEIIVDVAITKGIGKLKQLKYVNKIAGKIKDAIKKSPPMVAMAPLIKKGKKAGKVVDKADDVIKKLGTKFKKIEDVPFKEANPRKVVNALNNFKGKYYKYGDRNLLLDKKGLKHMLERHHPDFWDGSFKGKQSFFNKKVSLDEIEDAIGEVLKQNNGKIKSKGTNGLYQLVGTYKKGQTYKLGFNKGRIGQFYPEVLD